MTFRPREWTRHGDFSGIRILCSNDVVLLVVLSDFPMDRHRIIPRRVGVRSAHWLSSGDDGHLRTLCKASMMREATGEPPHTPWRRRCSPREAHTPQDALSAGVDNQLQYQTPYNTLSLVPISLTSLGDAPVKLPLILLFNVRKYNNSGGR